ncbi:type I toxin-antitoxin system Fst family toxin [Ruoffia tabacinasalis]
MSKELISLIFAPIVVGIVLELFAWWLDKQYDD